VAAIKDLPADAVDVLPSSWFNLKQPPDGAKDNTIIAGPTVSRSEPPAVIHPAYLALDDMQAIMADHPVLKSRPSLCMPTIGMDGYHLAYYSEDADDLDLVRAWGRVLGVAAVESDDELTVDAWRHHSDGSRTHLVISAPLPARPVSEASGV